MTKDWWKSAVVYQIYPRSFMDSNGDGIGDLAGITGKLDYLQNLGVDVIWLSPVYKSPNYDNGYDISGYQEIMSEFGTMADFDNMLAEAHKRGIKIVMDLVVNHTSSEHPWFIESRKGKDNPYRDYYIWRDKPNNWGACFGGSAWEFDEASGQYYLHTFAKQQPDLNWENPAVRKAIFDMMTWWCDKGADGFRMDVISMISKDQAFPDGDKHGGFYGDFSPFVCNGPRVHEYLREMRDTVLSKYDLLTVGETAGVTVEEARKYANLDGSELNMIFQFEHVSVGDNGGTKWTDARYTLSELRSVLAKWQVELDGKAWNSIYFGNHDQPRGVSRFGDDSAEYRELSAKLLATCQFALQGTVFVYQGEELAMTNAYFTDLSDYRDIEAINAFKENTEAGFTSPENMMKYLALRSRDNARTPLQWTGETNAGFTTGTPWISVNQNYKEINASAQANDPDSVFNYYKKLIALRKNSDVLISGKYETLSAGNENIWAFSRTLGDEHVVVLLNFSGKEAGCGIFPGETEMVIISNYESHKKGVLQPWEAIVYRQ